VSAAYEHRLILASKSKSRASVLRAAGLSFEQIGSGVDEDALKEALRAEGATVAKQADLLAETKAMKVSISHLGVVLGCDQMLDLDGQGLDKVATRAEAADVLRRLRGKTHVLQSAIVACVEGAPVWRHLSQPKLRVRNFSDDFLETYLDQIGDAPSNASAAIRSKVLAHNCLIASTATIFRSSACRCCRLCNGCAIAARSSHEYFTRNEDLCGRWRSSGALAVAADPQWLDRGSRPRCALRSRPFAIRERKR